MLKCILEKEVFNGSTIEEHYLFLSLQNVIMGFDMNGGYETVFLSDKLSNMINFHYNYQTKQLLIYNTSGHAYLYQMPEGKRLLTKLYLKADYLNPDSIVYSGNYYWYPDNKFCLRRLDAKTGKTKLILKDKEREVTNLVQSNNKIYIFTEMRKYEEGYVKILCYCIDENGELKYESEWGERPYVSMSKIKKDLDNDTIIVEGLTNTKYVGDYFLIFEPQNRKFIPIYPVSEETFDIHTILDKNKIIISNMQSVKVIDIPSRKVLAEYKTLGTIYNAILITSDKGVIFTSNGVYEFVL